MRQRPVQDVLDTILAEFAHDARYPATRISVETAARKTTGVNKFISDFMNWSVDRCNRVLFGPSRANQIENPADIDIERPFANSNEQEQHSDKFASSSQKSLKQDGQHDTRRIAGLSEMGNELLKLGGEGGQVDQLEKAAAIYREALREWTRDHAPLQWAMTQHNLGTALWYLGMHSHDTVRLKRAIAAYHEALKERTIARFPVRWATTQNNLGAALHILGERTRNVEDLSFAIEVYRSTLKVWLRETAPLDWSMAQNNLGNALLTLGTLSNNSEKLKDAVAAFRNALTVRTREETPHLWAITQNNLGTALAKFGQRTKSIPHIEEALRTYSNAIRVFEELGDSKNTEMVRTNIQSLERVPTSDGRGIEIYAGPVDISKAAQ